MTSGKAFANRHIPAFLSLPSTDLDDPESSQPIQVFADGTQVGSDRMKAGQISLSHPMLIRDSPQSLGMKLPEPSGSNKQSKKKRNFAEVDELSIRDIADTVGHDIPVNVIDVEHQEELEGWTMGDLVDYFEDEDRVMMSSRHHQQGQLHEAAQRDRHRHGQAALDEDQLPAQQIATQSGRRIIMRIETVSSRHKILNQISYEFSGTALGRQVRSPRFVRELDWIDHAWPISVKTEGFHPAVQVSGNSWNFARSLGWQHACLADNAVPTSLHALMPAITCSTTA